jgi:PAS domain-containing protein
MPAESRYRQLLDSIPLMVFVMDEDVRALDWNRAAADQLSLKRETTLNRRGGEILACLHHFETAQGCGHSPSCRDCVIRASVKMACSGRSAERVRMKAEWRLSDSVQEVELLITATPLIDSEMNSALLILEDVTEIVKLRGFLPICSFCKKIRNDAQYWQALEQYLHDNAGIDFSHGICPDCLREHYPSIKIDKK